MHFSTVGYHVKSLKIIILRYTGPLCTGNAIATTDTTKIFTQLCPPPHSSGLKATEMCELFCSAFSSLQRQDSISHAKQFMVIAQRKPNCT